MDERSLQREMPQENWVAKQMVTKTNRRQLRVYKRWTVKRGQRVNMTKDGSNKLYRILTMNKTNNRQF